MSIARNDDICAVEILVVDDSPTQAEQLKYLLEKHYYTVRVAVNGKHALALIDEQTPALVISDIVMPEMNGYELCRQIRGNDRTRDIPVVLLTSLSNTENVLEGLTCGADSFITKPYSEDYLFQHITKVLADYPMEKNQPITLKVEITDLRRYDEVSADPQRMLNLLISLYEAAVCRNNELILAQNELRSLNDHLESLVEERTAALSMEIVERKQAEEEISKLNIELEKRVAERTTQLEATNKDLESFAFSVSHDLRAPLRAIDGFSHILLEDHADRLDDDGRQLLNNVLANTIRMHQLISDLLTLCRAIHTDILSSEIDMTVLARSVYKEVATPEVQECFEFTVSPLPAAVGDISLLRQVWTNLLSNAIKYTMPREVRRIEVGGHTDKDMNIYFVQDSGVGFDPEYTHKLFGIFQRLHSVEEFEGTGIGLAIVQRIIRRHKGQVWAEGKVGEGAVFYFSLPIDKEQILDSVLDKNAG